MKGTAAPDAEKVVLVHDLVHPMERAVVTPRALTETPGLDDHEEPLR